MDSGLAPSARPGMTVAGTRLVFPLPLVGRGRGGGREGARDRRRLQGANSGPCDTPPDPHPDALRASTLPTRGRVMFIVLALRLFVGAPSFVHNAKKRVREARSSSDETRQWRAGCITIGGAVAWASATADARPATNDNQKIKDRRRNADRRCSVTSAPCGAARAFWARSPVGVPSRLLPEGLSSQGLSSRPCFRRLGRTSGPVRPPQPGGGDLALGNARSATRSAGHPARSCTTRGRYPRLPVPVQRGT